MKVTLLCLTCKANLIETILMMESYRTHSEGLLDVVLLTEEENVPLFTKHLPDARIMTLESLSTPRMLELKDSKTSAEHAWTHKGAAILKLLEEGSEVVFFCGSDMFFYSDVNKMIKDEIVSSGREMDGGVLCAPHRFLPNQDYTNIAGRYNADAVIFWGAEGKKYAKEWNDLLEEFCYRSENPLQKEGERPQCGDQTYLEQLDIIDIKHQGFNVADYNAGWFTFAKAPSGNIFLIDPADAVYPLVCYQMHDLKYEINDNKLGIRANYPLTSEQVQCIQGPYIQLFEETKGSLEDVQISFD